MDPDAQTSPDTPSNDPQDSQQDDSPGFWKRMFGGSGEAEEAEPAPKPQNTPRKRTKTIFDRAEAEQKKRYSKAASVRRDKLATAIGDRVEGVIAQQLEGGERRLAQVSTAFDDMNMLLGGIGRNLDLQDQRAERMARTLESLPKAAERERIVLESIADKLEEQGDAIEGVPEVVSLVKHGSKMAEERLFALKSLKGELELQREQRDQVLAVLRQSSLRFEERMTSLEETITNSQIEARSDTVTLRQAIERNTEESRQDAEREGKRGERVIDSLSDVSRRLSEGNVLASANAAQQDRSLNVFQDSQQRLLDQFVRSQNHTVSEMHRLEDEAREREEALARQGRMTLVGSVGFLAIMAAAFFGARQAPVAQSPIYLPVRSARVAPAVPKAETKPSDRTLPAGMPRAEAVSKTKEKN